MSSEGRSGVSVEIRALQPDELPVLWDLFRAYLQEFDAHLTPTDYYDPAWFARLLLDGSLQAFLAWLDRPIGFVLLQVVQHWYRQSSRGGVIEEMYVAPGYRRRGYGTALVQRAVDALRAQEVTSISAAVLRTNTTGLLFWQRLGFKMEVYDLYLSQE